MCSMYSPTAPKMPDNSTCKTHTHTSGNELIACQQSPGCHSTIAIPLSRTLVQEKELKFASLNAEPLAESGVADSVSQSHPPNRTKVLVHSCLEDLLHNRQILDCCILGATQLYDAIKKLFQSQPPRSWLPHASMIRIKLCIFGENYIDHINHA